MTADDEQSWDAGADPIQNAIYREIKGSIRLCLENNFYGAAVKLIYAGIDAMAALGLPAEREDVHRKDFVSWCDRYIRLRGPVQLPGIEYYAARCAMLHQHGVKARLSREGKVRVIGYVDDIHPAVKTNPAIDPNLVIISTRALSEAFFRGIDHFLVDVFGDPSLRSVVESRLSWIATTAKVESLNDDQPNS